MSKEGDSVGLTDDELEVLEHLAAATTAFFNLPEHHPTDMREWAQEIHHLQHRVMSRAAVRWRPELFTPISK